MTEKNHFLFAYAGNKRAEVKQIYDHLDFKRKTKYIVEPFAGTVALSFYIAKVDPHKYTYHINDMDKNLIELYRIMKDKERCDEFEKKINLILSDDSFGKQEYNKITRGGSVEGYYIKHKIYAIVPGLYKQNYVYDEIKFDDYPIVNFLRNENVIITNDNGVDILRQYENNDEAIIYLDPPYIQTCNDFYSGPSGTRFNVYEYICMKKYRNSNIYATLEDVWIVNLICQDYNILDTYAKQYQTSKKKTKHIFYRLEKKRKVRDTKTIAIYAKDPS